MTESLCTALSVVFVYMYFSMNSGREGIAFFQGELYNTTPMQCVSVQLSMRTERISPARDVPLATATGV